MTIFLNVGVPLLSITFYAAVALTVFHRFRRRHLQHCVECRAAIEKNITMWKGEYPWNHLLCDKYDVGAFGVAAFWPIAWFAYQLYVRTAVETKPPWLRERELEDRIKQLETEAGIR